MACLGSRDILRGGGGAFRTSPSIFFGVPLVCRNSSALPILWAFPVCAAHFLRSRAQQGQVMSMQVCLNTRIPSEDNARQANTKHLSRSQRQGAARRQKCSFPKGPCSCIVFTKGPKRFPCSYFRTEVYTI